MILIFPLSSSFKYQEIKVRRKVELSAASMKSSMAMPAEWINEGKN